jgi:hypothetical protein
MTTCTNCETDTSKNSYVVVDGDFPSNPFYGVRLCRRCYKLWENGRLTILWTSGGVPVISKEIKI